MLSIPVIEMSPNQPYDPYTGNVVLNLNGASTTDAAMGKTITLYGATISGANLLFGHNTFLTGSGQYIESNGGIDYAFSTGDFCIEFTIKRTLGSSSVTILDFYNSSANTWQIYTNPNNNGIILFTNSEILNILAGASLSNGQWHSFCIERFNGTISGYYGGNLKTSINHNFNFNGQMPKLGIGCIVNRRTPGTDFIGHIGNIRITKGVARYRGKNYEGATRDFSTVPGWIPQHLAGDGVLSGKFLIKGIPVQNAMVRAFSEEAGEIAGETFTDSQGDFLIPNLTKNKQFFLIFKDPGGLWEYRCSSRRVPV